MDIINKEITNFKLETGYSAETSGGVFLMIDRAKAEDFIAESKELYG